MSAYVRLLVAAGLWLHLNAAMAAPDTAQERRMRPCVACHGDHGRATADGYYPRIAGKPAGYLHEQLLNFRDGRRLHADMAYLVGRQRDAFLEEMAEYFANLDLPYPAPLPAQADAATLARGESLVHSGDEARKIPACVACHGDRLTGLQPAVPGLIGLPYDYLAAQLGSWREGVRHARAPDCMSQIARSLDPLDIEAVAAWLATQPVPADARAPAGEIHVDLRCGSLEPRS